MHELIDNINVDIIQETLVKRKMSQLKYSKQTLFYKSSENMQELADESIDVIITSPPYNVGKKYSVNGTQYNDKRNVNEYLAFLETIFTECYRVASKKCLFFLNIGDSAKSQGKSEDVIRRAEKAGFIRLQSIIWVKSVFGKGHFTPSGRDRRLNNLWEYVYILYKTKEYQLQPKTIGIPYSDKSNIGRYSDVDKRDAGDIWFIPYTKTTGATIKKGHDAPFPIELPYQCLKLVKDPKTVLDPFAGTGSTLRAAEALDLHGFGYEILPREDVIIERLQENFSPLNVPLIPQMETYIQFITQFLEKLSNSLTENQIIECLKSFNTIPKRQFAWACYDLKLNPKILSFISKDDKVFPKKDTDSIKNN